MRPKTVEKKNLFSCSLSLSFSLAPSGRVHRLVTPEPLRWGFGVNGPAKPPLPLFVFIFPIRLDVTLASLADGDSRRLSVSPLSFSHLRNGFTFLFPSSLSYEEKEKAKKKCFKPEPISTVTYGERVGA